MKCGFWILSVGLLTCGLVDAARELPKVMKFPEVSQRLQEPNLCAYLGVEGGLLNYNLWTCGAPRKSEYCSKPTKVVYDCCPGYLRSEILDGKCGEAQSVWRLIPDYLKTYGQPKFGNLLESVPAAQILSVNDSQEAYTVFAPYDDELLTSGETNFLESRADPHPVLRHVAKGRFYSADMKDGSKLESLHNDKSIKISVYSNNLIFVECRALVKPNLETRNGLVHLLSGPLPIYKAPTVLKQLESDPDTSEFTKALSDELKTKLGKEDSPVWYTVLAPNNAAWNQVKSKYPNKQDLQTVAANHVMERLLCAESITQPSDKVGPTAADENIGVDCVNPTPKRLALSASGMKVPFIKSDQMTKNGAVHVVGGVLEPISAMPLDNALATLNQKANVDIKKTMDQLKECGISLSESSKYIVLVPLAEAHQWFQNYKPFNKEYQRFQSDKTYRCNVYRYHVLQITDDQIQGKEPKLWNQNSFPTMAGVASANYFVKTRFGTDLFFENSRAKELKPTKFKNGFIYLMDRINVLPEKKRMDLMPSNKNLSQLMEKMGSVNYASFLSQKGPLSLFLAPINKGWSTRPEAKYTGTAMTNFLKLHTLKLRLWGDDVGYLERETYQSAESELSFKGKPFQLRFKRGLDGTMHIGHDALPELDWAMVIDWNLYGTDGMVWVIDWPIRCPPGYCDASWNSPKDNYVVYAAACGVSAGVGSQDEFSKNPLSMAQRNSDKCVLFKSAPKVSYQEWRVTYPPNSGN
jgi:uncharacterized surface protein with fasciclin (FAS1) repeats